MRHLIKKWSQLHDFTYLNGKESTRRNPVRRLLYFDVEITTSEMTFEPNHRG